MFSQDGPSADDLLAAIKGIEEAASAGNGSSSASASGINIPMASPPPPPGISSYGPALSPAPGPTTEATPYGLQNAPSLPHPANAPKQQSKNGLGPGVDPWANPTPQQQQQQTPMDPSTSTQLNEFKNEVTGQLGKMGDHWKALLEQHNTTIHQDFQSTIQKANGELLGKVGLVVDGFNKELSDKISKLEKWVETLGTQVGTNTADITYLKGQFLETKSMHDKALAAIVLRLEALEVQKRVTEQEVGQLRATVAADLTNVQVDIGWDSPPDQSKLYISSPASVQKSEVVKALSSFWNGHLTAEDFAVWGAQDVLGKGFIVQFNGDAGRGARLARKALGLRRDSNGQWNDVYVKTPTGDTVKLYINPNKSPKQRKLESSAKRLFTLIKTALPQGIQEHEVQYNRRDGVVSCKWLKIAKVNITSRDDPPTLLFTSHFETLGFDKEQIKYRFANYSLDGGNGAEDMWCV